MGKSTKPTKWFKAVKKAFRSPSKERPSPRNKQGDDDEKLLTKQDFPPVSYPAPTPHPLPSFEIVTHNEVSEPQHSHGPPPALPTAPDQAVTEPAMPENHFDSCKSKPKEVEEEQKHYSRNGNMYVVEKHHDDDDDSAVSEEDEAATRIQQSFLRSPLALKGLIRLQALVRGQLVRRQAAITLRTMEAIVRVQALFRGRRVRMSKDGRAVKSRIARIQRLGSRLGAVHGDARREDFQEMTSSEAEHEANKRRRRTAYLLTQQLKRSTPNRSSSFIDCDPDQPHEGWAWLELWTNAKAWESRQLDSAHESKLDPKDYIEIIPGSSRRTSDYTTVKEVDVNTLNKVKYYENGISKSNPVSAFDGTSKALVSDEEEEEEEEFTPKKLTSPNLTTPSPAASQEAINVPPSPQASEASVKLDSADEDPSSMVMEHLVLPEAANGSTTHSDSFSTSNDVHQPAGPGDDDAANAEVAAPEVVNGTITRNGHQEIGDCNKIRKEESPVPSKRTTCRYMAATESAKAKFRSSSNPKTRGSTPETPESPGQATPKQRNSIGGGGTNGIGKAAEFSSKTPVAFGTRKTTSNAVQNRRSPSPRTGGLREKPRSVDAGHGGVSPARRNSLGSGDDKRWRT